MPIPHHSHHPEDIRRRLSQGPRFSYLRDWIYGGIDGGVTTFAVVSGVVGAELSTRTILILGFANLIADGFSMAAGNYLGTKAEADERKKVEEYERRQIHQRPEGEKEEVRQILKMKGFEGDLLDQAVELFTSDRDRWVELMLSEEYGLPMAVRSPWKAASSTFFAFFVCGFIPLFPYLFFPDFVARNSTGAFALASASTGITFFIIGSIKSRWVMSPWWRSGFSTFLVGMLAAGIAYGIGDLLKTIGQ